MKKWLIISTILFLLSMNSSITTYAEASTEDWVYGWGSYDDINRYQSFVGPYLYKVKPDGTQKQVLKENFDGKFVKQSGNYIYFIMFSNGYLFRMKKDLTGLKQITKKPTNQYIIQGNRIYYSSYSRSPYFTLHSINVDGTNDKKYNVLMEPDLEVFKVQNNWIYFNQYKKEKNFYKMKTDGTKIKNYNIHSVDEFVVNGNYVYYTTMNNGKQSFNRITLDGKKNTRFEKDYVDGFMLDGERIYYLLSGKPYQIGSKWFSDCTLKTMDMNGENKKTIKVFKKVTSGLNFVPSKGLLSLGYDNIVKLENGEIKEYIPEKTLLQMKDEETIKEITPIIEKVYGKNISTKIDLNIRGDKGVIFDILDNINKNKVWATVDLDTSNTLGHDQTKYIVRTYQTSPESIIKLKTFIELLTEETLSEEFTNFLTLDENYKEQFIYGPTLETKKYNIYFTSEIDSESGQKMAEVICNTK